MTGIFHREAHWTTHEGRKKQRRSNGTGWRSRGALRRNGMRGSDSTAKVSKERTLGGRNGMGWGWTARGVIAKQAEIARGSFPRYVLARRTSSARARRALTFVRVGRGIPTTFDTVRAHRDYHTFDIDLWRGCDIAVARTTIIDLRDSWTDDIPPWIRQQIFLCSWHRDVWQFRSILCW